MDAQDGMTESTSSTTPIGKSVKICRPARQSAAPVPWSVRGVEADTRRAIEKAAGRVGKTIGQYLNEDVRGFAQGQLTQTRLPAAPVDIQNQIDHLTQMVEGIANRLPEQRQPYWHKSFSQYRNIVLVLPTNIDHTGNGRRYY